MNAIVSTIGPLPTNRFSHRRLAREWKTVTAMVHIYCREQHGNSLCAECQGLMHYISLRLDRCRFGADKPTCAKCPVHCYQRDRREQIKDVMKVRRPADALEASLVKRAPPVGWVAQAGRTVRRGGPA